MSDTLGKVEERWDLVLRPDVQKVIANVASSVVGSYSNTILDLDDVVQEAQILTAVSGWMHRSIEDDEMGLFGHALRQKLAQLLGADMRQRQSVDFDFEGDEDAKPQGLLDNVMTVGFRGCEFPDYDEYDYWAA